MVALTEKKQLHIYQELCYRLLRALTDKAYAEKGRNRNYYPFIAHSTGRTIEQIYFVRQLLKRQYGANFLDVGCGVGNIMLIAESFDFYVAGIECSKETLKRAMFPVRKRMVRHNEIWNGNAFNFKDYADFDVIYFYCPISDHYLEGKLERQIEDKMKVGAILIANLKQDGRIIKDERFRKLQGNSCYDRSGIWKKVKD